MADGGDDDNESWLPLPDLLDVEDNKKKQEQQRRQRKGRISRRKDGDDTKGKELYGSNRVARYLFETRQRKLDRSKTGTVLVEDGNGNTVILPIWLENEEEAAAEQQQQQQQQDDLFGMKPTIVKGSLELPKRKQGQAFNYTNSLQPTVGSIITLKMDATGVEITGRVKSVLRWTSPKRMVNFELEKINTH